MRRTQYVDWMAGPSVEGASEWSCQRGSLAAGSAVHPLAEVGPSTLMTAAMSAANAATTHGIAIGPGAAAPRPEEEGGDHTQGRARVHVTAPGRVQGTGHAPGTVTGTGIGRGQETGPGQGQELATGQGPETGQGHGQQPGNVRGNVHALGIKDMAPGPEAGPAARNRTAAPR